MSSRKALFIFALLVACCGSSARRTLAQEVQRADNAPAAPTSAAPQNNSTAASPQTNDLEITANVTARELRFEVVPEPTVEFTGQPQRDTVWEAERQNLPRPVQPGVTYRNIGIQLVITSRFADIERIVAEALGEVPVTDERTPQNPAPPPNTKPATTSPSTTEGRKP